MVILILIVEMTWIFNTKCIFSYIFIYIFIYIVIDNYQFFV